LVGRERELAQLHSWFDKALSGERQLVFVTGEAGIGKTTLVDAFLQSLESENQKPLLSEVRTRDPIGTLRQDVEFQSKLYIPEEGTGRT
jgi:predicted ATPase